MMYIVLYCRENSDYLKSKGYGKYTCIKTEIKSKYKRIVFKYAVMMNKYIKKFHNDRFGKDFYFVRGIEETQNGYTPKNCIAKTKQDCFYFQCIHNSHNGGECVQEKELPADGIELRHKVKVVRIDRTTFRDWPQIIKQTAKLINNVRAKNETKII